MWKHPVRIGIITTTFLLLCCLSGFVNVNLGRPQSLLSPNSILTPGSLLGHGSATGSGAIAYKETLGAGTNTTGTTVTANVTINTLGSPVSLGTSTAAEVAVQIALVNPQQGKAYLVDVGADTAGGTSYVYFVQRIPIVAANAANGPAQTVVILLPMAFPSGTQFAARCQSDTTAATVQVYLNLYTGTTPFTVSYVDTFGASTATSRGTSVDSGAAGDTKGAYAQLVASSAGEANFLLPVVQHQPAQTAGNTCNIWLDVSTGAGGSEIVKVGNVLIFANVTTVRMEEARPFEVDIPASTRVAARTEEHNTTAGRREADVAVLAFMKSS
jgi:hypothetical protein